MNEKEYVRFLEARCNEESCEHVACDKCKWNNHYKRLMKGKLGLKEVA